LCSKACVSGIVKITLIGFKDKASRITGIAAIRKSTAMCGWHKMHCAKFKNSSTKIHWMHFIVTLLGHPLDNFKIGNYCSLRLFCQRQQICYMVVMPMRYKDIIGLDTTHIHIFCQRIMGNEGVEQYRSITKFHQEARMTKISKFHSTNRILILYSNLQK